MRTHQERILSGIMVYQAETPYSRLQVVDSGRTVGDVADGDGGRAVGSTQGGYERVRSLYLNGDLPSRMYVDRPTELAVMSTKYFPLSFVFNPDAEKVLFVGGRGFSGPKHFLAEFSHIMADIVEIDPVVLDAALEYEVKSDDERLGVYNDDGRRFRLSDQGPHDEYDVIILYSTESAHPLSPDDHGVLTYLKDFLQKSSHKTQNRKPFGKCDGNK